MTPGVHVSKITRKVLNKFEQFSSSERLMCFYDVPDFLLTLTFDLFWTTGQGSKPRSFDHKAADCVT